jgi:hypothetical protein
MANMGYSTVPIFTSLVQDISIFPWSIPPWAMSRSSTSGGKGITIGMIGGVIAGSCALAGALVFFCRRFYQGKQKQNIERDGCVFL